MEARYIRSDNTDYGNTLESTNYFCPNCGKKKIWEEIGDGDVYVGTALYCTSCKFVFTMPNRGICKQVLLIKKEDNE